jgi:hypothetical protein
MNLVVLAAVLAFSSGDPRVSASVEYRTSHRSGSEIQIIVEKNPRSRYDPYAHEYRSGRYRGQRDDDYGKKRQDYDDKYREEESKWRYEQDKLLREFEQKWRELDKEDAYKRRAELEREYRSKSREFDFKLFEQRSKWRKETEELRRKHRRDDD